MALLYANGFDHYIASGSSEFLPFEPGTWLTGGQAAPYVEATPSIGGFALSAPYANDIGNSNNRCSALFNLPMAFSAGDTIGIGFMMYATAYPQFDERGTLVALSSGTQDTYSCIGFTPTGAIRLKSQPNDNPGYAISSSTIPLNTRVHIEVQWYLHGSNGSMEVRVNGVEWVKATGINTLLAGPTITRLGFFARQVNTGGSTDRQCFLDHMFVYDKSGSEHNDWFGPRLITTLEPDGDVSLPGSWSLNGASDATDILGHMPVSPTTHYMESDDAADPVKVLLSEFEGMANIDAVVPVFQAFKNGLSANEVRVGVENDDGLIYGNLEALTDTASFYQAILVKAPDEGGWTTEKLSGLKLVVGG